MNKESYSTFSIKPTRLFKETLQEHQTYFLEQENDPDWVQKWGDAVIQISKTLSIFPFRYRIIRNNIRRLKLNKKYSVLYRVDEGNLTVYVLGCVHTGWQLSEFFDRAENASETI